MDLGVLVAVPLESLVVRAAVATLGVVLVVRVLLRLGLMRTPSARIATALAPMAALLAIVLFTGTSPRPPLLMFPAEGARAIPIPVSEGSLNFAPVAVPLLVGVWASISGVLLSRRFGSVLRMRRCVDALASVTPPHRHLQVVAGRIARQLGVAQPQVVVRPAVAGGAFVVGAKRPVVVIGADLLASLDSEELEGVLAHELAHVRRRDTLVATLLGTLRDLTFFLPGGSWALHQLHRERELAADRVAVGVTKRPGALASGLLKVLDVSSARAHACAALVPSGDLVERVRILVDEAPAPSRLRRGSETAAVAFVVLGATTAGLLAPAVIAGPDAERDALAFVWSSTPGVTAAEVPSGEPRVFDVYRRTATLAGTRAAEPASPRIDERTAENRRALLRACAAGECPTAQHTLGLRPQPTVSTLDGERWARWNATQVGRSASSDGFRLFWLSHLE